MASITGFFHGGITVRDMDVVARASTGTAWAWSWSSTASSTGRTCDTVLGLDHDTIRAVYLRIPGGGFVELLEYRGIERLVGGVATVRLRRRPPVPVCRRCRADARPPGVAGLPRPLGAGRGHHGRPEHGRAFVLHGRPGRVRRGAVPEASRRLSGSSGLGRTSEPRQDIRPRPGSAIARSIEASHESAEVPCVLVVPVALPVAARSLALPHRRCRRARHGDARRRGGCRRRRSPRPAPCRDLRPRASPEAEPNDQPPDAPPRPAPSA